MDTNEMTRKGQERIACELLARCEPNLRALLVADLASDDPARVNVVAWINEHGSLDDSGRIVAPARVAPASIASVTVTKRIRKVAPVAKPHVSRQATERTRYPCGEYYAFNPDKPDDKVFCGKFHETDEPHGRNRAIRRTGFDW